MRHFVGGFAVGFLVAIVGIRSRGPVTRMDNFKFSAFMAAHLFVAVLFGLAAWGLWP